jgi:hypothetical protein
MANSIIEDMREGQRGRGATLGLAARGCGGVEGAEVGEEAAAPTYGRGGYTSKGLRKSSTRRRAIGAWSDGEPWRQRWWRRLVVTCAVESVRRPVGNAPDSGHRRHPSKSWVIRFGPNDGELKTHRHLGPLHTRLPRCSAPTRLHPRPRLEIELRLGDRRLRRRIGAKATAPSICSFPSRPSSLIR